MISEFARRTARRRLARYHGRSTLGAPRTLRIDPLIWDDATTPPTVVIRGDEDHVPGGEIRAERAGGDVAQKVINDRLATIKAERLDPLAHPLPVRSGSPANSGVHADLVIAVRGGAVAWGAVDDRRVMRGR